GQAALAVHRITGPHLLTVDHPATVDPPGPGSNRRRVRAGSRLAEQLAPPQVTLQARPDQSLDLFRATVLQQRWDHPFTEAKTGFVQTVQGVLDDELLDAVGGPAVRSGPIWLQITAARPEPLVIVARRRLQFWPQIQCGLALLFGASGQVDRRRSANAVAWVGD